MIRLAQNHPQLKLINMASMAGIIVLNILMVIANPSAFPILIFTSASTVLFIINVLFYILSEEQRELIIKYRVFTVYILAGLILFFCLINLIQWIIYTPVYIFKFPLWASWLLSILWIIFKSLQASTFSLIVARASQFVGGKPLMP